MQWNILIYRVPSQPSSKRVYVWRKLKGWGGLYLQQSVCIFPMEENLQENLIKLKQEIITSDGEADLLTVKINNDEQNQKLIQRFQQQANQEYQEFLGRCHDLHTELKEEREKNNLTFAELDENEAELNKLNSWLPKIKERDFFNAENYNIAVEALKNCQTDFNKFSEQVFSVEELGN